MNTRTLILALLSSLVVVAILTTSAHGAAADCQATTVVAAPEADAWIDANSVLANKGSDAVLNVGDTSRALVRFSLPPGVPGGCVVESARLRLFADSGTEGSRVEVLPLSFGWSERLVTWTTQPPALGSAVGAWSRDGYMQWNITSLVPAMLDGADHGFLVRDAAEGTEHAGGHGFYAREKGQNAPELVIRFAPPPSGEPAPPAPPTPSVVTCGQLVTESTLLTNDLTNCPADGILIGAPRIVLDLGGHTVDGVGLGTGVRNEGYEAVTVRNGAVQEFDHGVELLEETRRNVIERLTLRHNQVAAIELFNAGGSLSGNELRANTVDDNGGGILLLSGTMGTIVSANTLTLNSGAALLLRDSDNNRLEGNRVVGGGDLGVGLQRSSGNSLIGTVVSDTSDGGIEILAGSHGNRVEGSHVTRSGDTGILVAESERNELIGNTTVGMSDSGITLNSASDGIVSDNKLGGNPGGLQMDGSSRNLIEANDASHGTGIGIELGGGSYGNTLVLNTADGNGAQGIYVADEALLDPGNLLHRNTANDNGSDGIAVAKGGHTLTANVALRNRGWGINAVGLNFAARNVADDNGQAGDCLGILCSPPDVTPPETSVESAPDAFVNTTTAVFAFSANEEFASFECSLDGAAFTACTSPRVYMGLTEGDHEFRARATDESGNVDATPVVYRWEIDHTAPGTAIDSGPAALTSSRTAVLTFSSDEPSTFECALDDGGFEPCSSPQTYGDLAEGFHALRIRATDAAGNTDPTPAAYGWTVDNTPPETTVDTKPDPLTSTTTALFTFSADESATFECALDDAAYEPCSSPQTYRDLAEGDHELHIRATDAAGNTDPTPASHAWTIEHPAPETSIDSGPVAPTASTTAMFTFSASEPASFECALDSAAYEPCSSPQTYSDLAEGDHELRVRATDEAGNTDPTPAAHPWAIDNTPPDIVIDSGPAALTADTTATFTFSASEPASFECALDNAAYEPCSSPHTYSDLAEGDHEFGVRATDAAGNLDATAATDRWTIEPPPDTTAPETTIDSAPEASTESTTASLTFSSNEAATFACALDDGAWEPCRSPQRYTDLSRARHEFRVRATDSAGNTDVTPASHAWTIEPPRDTTAPETTIDAGPDAVTSSATAAFTFSSSETGSTFECSLDQAAFATCSSPQPYSDLMDGDHEFSVRATDTAGNTDAAPETHAWTIDSTPPETTIDAGPDPITSSMSATFTLTTSETGSTFECSLDGGAFAGCTSPQAYTDLAAGEHQFRVRAIDRAGNADATPAARRWTIDGVAPQTTITSAPTATTAATGARFTFSAGEDGATFECSLDGAAFTACVSPREYADLSLGGHDFRVRGSDAAGNMDATPAGHVWTIQAASVCSASTVTAAANADTWVLESSPSSNYREDSALKVDSKAGANARVLVRFGLPPVPAGCQVTGARLRVYADSYKTERTLAAFRLGATWTEAGVTWNNQPATTDSAATTASGQGYREWQVTSHVQSMYTGGNYGFLIRDASEGGTGVEQAFNSREKGSDNPPQLTITFG